MSKTLKFPVKFEETWLKHNFTNLSTEKSLGFQASEKKTTLWRIRCDVSDYIGIHQKLSNLSQPGSYMLGCCLQGTKKPFRHLNHELSRGQFTMVYYSLIILQRTCPQRYLSFFAKRVHTGAICLSLWSVSDTPPSMPVTRMTSHLYVIDFFCGVPKQELVRNISLYWSTIAWNYPTPSNSHHEDYSIFSRESL